ncbi:PA14 domain-containing protein, partial [Shewanella benthica]
MGSTLLPAYAADWTATFIEGVNSYSSDGKIEFKGTAKLHNASQNGNLPTFDVAEEQKSCVPPNGNVKNCKNGGYTARLPEDRIPFQRCRSTSNYDIGPPSPYEEITIPEGEYADVLLTGGWNRNITFSTENGIYKLKSLTAESGTLKLAAGQYWIESLQINRDVNIIFPPTGTVSFFVRDNYTHLNSSLSYSAEQFILYAYSDVKINYGVYLRGYVVAEGGLQLEDLAVVEGGVTSDDISLATNSLIYFNDTAASINVVPDCGVEPVLPVVPLQCPAGQAGVTGITYRTYDATSWKPGQYTSPGDHNDFNSLVDTVKTTTNQLGESIESRIEGYGGGISPHSSQGDNYAGIFTGYLDVPETGEYTLGIDGDDSIELLIDGQLVVGFYGLHGQCGWPCRTGDISLAQGTHKIEVRYHEATGAEAYHLYWQPPSALSLVKVPESAYLTCPFPQFEFGRVSLSSGSAVINFKNSYATAPVIILMPTLDSANPTQDGPGTVRLVSSGATTAAIEQNEPPSNKVSADDMSTVDYFVMEPGYRFLERGKALQAGKVETKKYQGKLLTSAGRGYENISFRHKFGAKPAMVGQTLSRHNNRFITTVINNISFKGDEFDIAIEASEVDGSITQDETLGYVAGLGAGSMQVDGEVILYEFDYALNSSGGNRPRTLLQQCAYSTFYENTYSSQPYVIANKNSRRGADGGWVRRCRHSVFNNTISFAIDEDQQSNAERNHLAENIGYFAFEAVSEPPAIDHYRIEFSSDAISCAAKDILIRACANTDCTAETSVLSSVDLTKNGGVYTRVNFTGHTVPAAELWHAEGGTALIGLGGTAPYGIYRCFIDDVEVDNTACQLTFEDTGLYFNLPDTISYKDSDLFELFAVTKDTSTQQCVPLFSNQAKSIDFSFNYKDPSLVNNPAPLTLMAPTESKVIAGGDTESVSVQFDANGKALLSVNYPEAGEVTLKASYTHTVTTPNGTEELVLEHQDNFVAKPAGFHFFNVSTNRCDSSDPYDEDCKVLAKAGESFDMRLKAVGWRSDGDSDFSDNPALKNFKHSNILIQAAVEMPSIADGGINGGFSTSAVDFNLSASDGSQLINQSWNEVGTVTAKLAQDISYLGVTISENNASSEVFGRFTPAYLDISANSPSLTHSCSTFTYMDQSFVFSGGGEPIIQVKGMVADGSEASNYQLGDWWRYKHKKEASRNQWPGRGYEDKTGELQIQDSEYPGLSGSVRYANNANTATLTGAEVEYVRSPTPTAPFDAKFDLKLAVTDVTDEDDICYKADSSGSCQPFSFEDLADGASFELRYGRLLLDNGYGPQSESLRLPLRTEYVSAVTAANVPTWIINVDDSCSVYNTVTSMSTGEAATTGMNM